MTPLFRMVSLISYVNRYIDDYKLEMYLARLADEPKIKLIKTILIIVKYGSGMSEIFIIL